MRQYLPQYCWKLLVSGHLQNVFAAVVGGENGGPGRGRDVGQIGELDVDRGAVGQAGQQRHPVLALQPTFILELQLHHHLSHLRAWLRNIAQYEDPTILFIIKPKGDFKARTRKWIIFVVGAKWKLRYRLVQLSLQPWLLSYELH